MVKYFDKKKEKEKENHYQDSSSSFDFDNSENESDDEQKGDEEILNNNDNLSWDELYELVEKNKDESDENFRYYEFACLLNNIPKSMKIYYIPFMIQMFNKFLTG